MGIEMVVCFPILYLHIGKHTTISILNTHNLNTIKPKWVQKNVKGNNEI